MARNTGKTIEQSVGKALAGLLGKVCVMVRVQDTKSAAYFLPPTPGDFMGTFMPSGKSEGLGIPVLIECKSSDHELSLKGCSLRNYVKPTQYSYNTMWAMCGGVSLVMFHSIKTKEVEYWDGAQIMKAYKEGWTDQVVSGRSGDTPKEIAQGLTAFVYKDS